MRRDVGTKIWAFQSKLLFILLMARKQSLLPWMYSRSSRGWWISSEGGDDDGDGNGDGDGDGDANDATKDSDMA